VSLRALVRPAAGDPEGALVLLHGRGADEHDLHGLLDLLDPERRYVGATPRAPLSLPPGGAHWYALGGLGTPDRETFDGSFRLGGEWLDGFLAEHGVDHDRLVLGGFSQGAVMTYALGLGAGRPRPRALVALSGFVPRVEGWSLDLAPPLPPVAIGHGVYDAVIPVDFGREARALLEEADAPVLYGESPIPHMVDPRFLERVREQLLTPA
jgi:phospholipase/carboxylesterase